jgi:hypothetical protein
MWKVRQRDSVGVIVSHAERRPDAMKRRLSWRECVFIIFIFVMPMISVASSWFIQGMFSR